MLFDDSPASVSAVLAIWMCGARVISLPGISRGMAPVAYRRQLKANLCGEYTNNLVLYRSDQHIVWRADEQPPEASQLLDVLVG